MNARIQKLGLLLGSLLIAACAGGKDGADGATGTPGPEGEGGPRPRIDSVSPPVGSLRNVVFLTGTSFSAVASENEVRFGGETASVIDATATTLTVRPPYELDPGYAPITVTRGENISAPAGFTLVLSGTELPSRFAAPVVPGEPVELADGRLLVPDASTGAILLVENDGVVREFARGQGLTAPLRLTARADGKVLVFDPSSDGVFRVDPNILGVVEVEHWGTPYAGGSHDAAGNLFAFELASGSIDRIAPDGTVTPAWCTAPASVVTDVQVIGADVFLSLAGIGPGSVVKCSTAAAGAPALVTATGIGIIHSLAPAGAELVAGGIFTATNDQEGVVRIAANGAITAVTTDPAGQGRYGVVSGAILLQGGEYLVADAGNGFLGELAGTALTVRAGAVAGDGASLRVGQKTFAAAYRGAFAPGWLVELNDDGSSRVTAQGRFAQLIAGADDTTVVAVRPDDQDLASIAIASGVVTSLFSVAGELTAPSGVTRDAAGNWYVSSTADGMIAQYASAGAVSSASFASVPGAGTLHAQATSLLASAPSGGRVDRVSFSGGAVSPWLAPGAGVDPAFVFRDLDESNTRDLVADRAGNRVVDVDSYGFVAAFATGLPGASSIAQRADGMLLVRCSDGVHLLTP